MLPVAFLVSTALTRLVLRELLILKARRPQPKPSTTTLLRVPCLPVRDWPALPTCNAAQGRRRQSRAQCVAERGAAPQGPCPNCNTENFTYFGDIFTVKGNREENTVDCRECKAKLTFKAEERAVRAVQALGVYSKPLQGFMCNAFRRASTGAPHRQQSAQLCALTAWEGFGTSQRSSSSLQSSL